MDIDLATQVRKLTEHYAYASLQMHEAVARKAGLPGTDHKYLGFLMKQGPMTAGELAVLTGLTTGAVTGLIDRLEKKKLVKREFAEDDRRKVFIVPNTKKITAMIVPLYRDYRGKSEKLIRSFSTQELHVIEKYFAKAIEIMSETVKQFNEK